MRTNAVIIGLFGLLAAASPCFGADADRDLDRHAAVIDHAATTPPGQGRVAERIAGELNQSWGRSPGPYSAASILSQRAQNSWGFGETLIADRLAQLIANRLLAQPGNTLTPAQALAQATAQVTAERQQHMGFGRIARVNGVTVGGLMGSLEKTAKDLEKAEKTADRAADKTAKGLDVAADKAADKSARSAERSEGGGGHGGGGDHGGGGGKK